MAEPSSKRAVDISAYTADTRRSIRQAVPDDPALGPLAKLPGVWGNLRDPDDPDGDNPLAGRGWNLIALPFVTPGQPRRPFRLLMNQYNERLVFATVDDDVPNRGVDQAVTARADQLIAALDYEQTIRQIVAEDEGESGDAGLPGTPIHHEPGLFLHMKTQQVDGFDIARLASIPHGNAAHALGTHEVIQGPPTISNLSGFPEGVADDIVAAVAAVAALGTEEERKQQYLFPYHKFTDEPFRQLFSPANANALLQGGVQALSVRETTVFDLTTDVADAGILNIPFIERQADASVMRSIFWLMELDEPAPNGQDGNRLVLAYSQFIHLDFFSRRDGRPGLIRWPHISINMMEKIAPPPANTTADESG
jgi:hypothetical protein